MARRNSSKDIKGITAIGAAIIALVLVGVYAYDIFLGGGTRPVEGSCEFHFIDVGQGDCTMIVTDENGVVIDTGPNDCADETLKYINGYTDKIDYLILTHPHEDHIGGADEILESIKVENVIMSDAYSDTKTFTRLLDSIESSRVNLIEGKAGDSFSAGDISFRILAPLSEFTDMNDYSLVLRVEFGDTSIMVTGDAEKHSEDLIVEEYTRGELRSDILQLAHHGSNTSNTREFMEIVSPQYAVISCGTGNTYGHPHTEVIEKLEEADVPYFRTDKDSHTVFRSDGKDIEYIP